MATVRRAWVAFPSSVELEQKNVARSPRAASASRMESHALPKMQSSNVSATRFPTPAKPRTTVVVTGCWIRNGRNGVSSRLPASSTTVSCARYRPGTGVGGGPAGTVAGPVGRATGPATAPRRTSFQTAVEPVTGGPGSVVSNPSVTGPLPDDGSGTTEVHRNPG